MSSDVSANPPVTDKATAKVALLDQDLWQQFAHALKPADFYRSWLALQCHQINQCMRGVLVLGTVDTGPFSPVAYWPEGQGGSRPLAALAEQALSTRKGMVLKYDLPGTEAQHAERHGVAYPIQIDEHLYGVVAVEVMPRTQAELQTCMRQMQWASGWLEARLRQQQAESDSAIRERMVAALNLVASSLEQESFAVAAKGFVTELASQLSCERVSIGFVHGGHTKVEAVSHSAQFGKQMNLIRAMASAMDEAIDQMATIQYPQQQDSEIFVTRDHAALAAQHGTTTVLTVPLVRNGRVYGALCLERSIEVPFDGETVELCRSVAAVVGPVLEEKRRNDRWLIAKLVDSLRTQMTRLFGPEYFMRKLVMLGMVSLVMFFSLAMGQYTIKADTVLEGSVQRVIGAPFEGYVAEARVRAGDIVAQGDVLAMLDDRDLKLERLKWSSQRAQLRKQYDEAMAKRDRAQINIISAQTAQADAQLALIDEQLSRTQITAPYSGVIISGDLSQSLGASVRRGDVLFVIAPLDTYRIILKVNEHDINDIEVDQNGELVLSSMTETILPFTVQRITPVSTAEEGENYFRVEATLANDPEATQQGMKNLRPGMEGAGKISIEQRKLIWIWTHDMINRLRLWAWRWLS